METQLLVSFATILCSGVVSAWVTQRLIERRSERDFRRQKLEQLFLAFDAFRSILFAYQMQLLVAIAGQLDPKATIHTAADNMPKESNDYQMTVMLINVYFPELRPRFEDFMKTRDQLNTVWIKYIEHQKETKRHEPSFAMQFRRQMDTLHQQEETLKEAIFRIAAKIS